MPLTIQERSFTVESRRGDAVHADVRFSEADAPLPVVVMCHGFKGFKDWGPFPAWGRRLAEAGFVSVLFNFSHNGVSPEQPTQFTQMDRFAQNTFTRELDDLAAVLDAVAQRKLPASNADPARIGLMGHSRGGGTAILQTARDDRVKTLVTWSAVAGFINRFSPEQIDDWKRQGYTEIMNTRTGQKMRLDRVLYDDAMAHREALNVGEAAAEVGGVPWLIVHAEDDASVSIDEAETLAHANPEARLFRAGEGHTFGGAHPFEGEVPSALKAVWEETLAFFEEHLRA